MIISEFAQFLKINNSDKIKPGISKLNEWLILKFTSPCITNIDKIIHKEIYCATNKIGCFFFIAKSESGRLLLEALYKFCEYYDNYQKAKNQNKM